MRLGGVNMSNDVQLDSWVLQCCYVIQMHSLGKSQYHVHYVISFHVIIVNEEQIRPPNTR